jgi:8-oxo-dGTP diphosphatase/putative hydrolase of the HAD superfamily
MRSLQAARWLFFDMGNTLISEEASTACRIQRLAEAFDRHGASRSIEAIESAYKEASERFAPRLAPRAIEKLTDDLELRKLIQTEAPYPREMEVPFDGAIETLRLLSSHYKIGVIANQSPGSVERLTRWGLIPFISVCVASAEVGLEKPDPAIFDLALRHAGCSASEAVMIGDRLDNDIRPARLLGWKTVRVLQGPGRFQSPRDSWDEPDLTMANVTLIPAVLIGCHGG